jgi:two-component system sensor histidine kinase RpfC
MGYAFQELKRRLAARDDSEHEQAALRIVIVGLVLGYMACFHGSPAKWSAQDWTIILGLSGFFAVAIALFVSICLWPAKNIPRRLIGMIADNSGATWYMCLAGEYGFSMLGVLLFVTFGNGFRYGRRYLFLSQGLALVGFVGVLLFVTYWQGHRAAGVGLLIALVVLPLYISTLLERIQEARSKAEEANLAKTSFLANMSHEMRTPLNGIVGVVDLFKTTTLSPQQVELVGLLRHSITVLRSLVDDVLDITKIEAGRLTIELAPFDLHASINGLIQLLRPHAEAKGLLLKAFVDPALEYRLRGDSHHLRQILLNLLGNAIKFTERGEVTLSVNLKQESVAAITVRFEVKDTGIGIAREALPNIFERFVQADQSTTRKYGGTGLGTTIAKQLVELMGGNIGVESTFGEGSLFWIELPLLRDVDATSAQPEGADRIDSVSDEATTLLITAAPSDPDVSAALRSIGERHEVVTPANSIGAKLDQLKANGTIVRAVVAACPVDQACSAFNVTVQRLATAKVALIYIANGEISVVDRARVNSINGAYALERPTPKLIANAIHAITAGVDSTSTSVADLNKVLHQERAHLKILVAEDNPTNQKIIRQFLESAGYEVVLASDGEEALDLYELENPDVAILDFNMPQRTGIEVIQAIRAMEPPGVRMPAVILSASVTVEARQCAANAGADEFLGKPFEATALIQQIDRLGAQTPRGRMASTSANQSIRPILRVVNAETELKTSSDTSRSVTVTAGLEPGLVDGARLSQLEDIARDNSFLGELIAGFIGDVDDILQKTNQALVQENRRALPDLMHSLKGAAVGVGAVKLASLAADLDQSADHVKFAEIVIKVRYIEKCFESTAAFLRRYVDMHHQ